MKRALRSEEGSSLILIIFAGVISLAVVLGVMAATSLYVERKRLLGVADAAALSAAESFSLASASYSQGKVSLVLTSPQVASAVRTYLSALPPTVNQDIKIQQAHTKDGKTAHVSLSTSWNAPVYSLFFPEGVRITVSSHARTVIG